MSTTLAMNRIRGTATVQPSLHDHWTFTTVDELRQQGHRPPCQMCCNCGTFAVFVHSDTKHLSLYTNGYVNDLVQARAKSCNCGISTVFSQTATKYLLDLHKTRRPPYQCTATGESQEKRTIGIYICATTGVSTTSPR